MKKLLAVLLVLLAATLCFGAMAEETAVDYTGTWTVTSIEMGGQAMNPAALGFDMTVVLNADGTCTLTAMGIAQAGTWAVTETGITTTDADGVVDAYTLVDGQLIAEVDGAKFIFTYGAAEAVSDAEETAAATILADLTLGDFNGHWKLTTVRVMGMSLPAASMGLELDIVLQDGTGLYTFASVDGDGSVTLLFEAEEAPGTGTMLLGYVMDENGQKADLALVLAMYSDGTLVWDASTEEMEMIYVLELQVEETAVE